MSYEYFIDPKGRISGLLPGSKRYARAIAGAWPTATKARRKHVHATYKATGRIPSVAETVAVPELQAGIPVMAAAIPGVGAAASAPGLLGGVVETAGIIEQIPGTLDWIRDVLDVALPEELLGLELGGVSGAGAKLYNGVWVENGKVKYIYPGGKVRVLGYTPQFAKKKYRTRRRSKRLTKRDMYFGEIARSNPTTAMGIISQMI